MWRWADAVVSDWTLFLERKLALPLTLEASRLLDAIARNTLGWNSRSNEIGHDLLRGQARLHGRSFERARDELIARRIILLERGKPGRGHRDHYTLLLDEETPLQSGISSGTEKPAKKPAEKPAVERGRKEKGERRTPRQRDTNAVGEGTRARETSDIIASTDALLALVREDTEPPALFTVEPSSHPGAYDPEHT